MNAIAWTTFALVATYQLWVSVLVMRASIYERGQKWLQVIGIWLIPVVGAIVAHSMLRTEGRPPYKPEREWTEPRDNAS